MSSKVKVVDSGMVGGWHLGGAVSGRCLGWRAE